VFENKVLRIFGPKRDEVRGKWRGKETIRKTKT
jgi:hypothetical protein